MPAPTIGYNIGPLSGASPLTVTAEAVGAFGGQVTSVLWLFGDGATSTMNPATHTYQYGGDYTLSSTGTATNGISPIAWNIPDQTVTVTGIAADTNTLFLPLKALSDEEYASIRLRGMSNQWPTVIFDNGGYPLRDLYVWPIPQSIQGIELWLWEPLSTYAGLDVELNLPQGYERYLRFKLALELCAEFGKEPSPDLVALATEAEANLKRMNQQVPVMKTSKSFSNKPRSNFITFTGGLDTLPEF